MVAGNEAVRKYPSTLQLSISHTENDSYSAILNRLRSNPEHRIVANAPYGELDQENIFASNTENDSYSAILNRLRSNPEHRIIANAPYGEFVTDEVISEISSKKREAIRKSASRQNSQTEGLTKLSSGDWFYKLDIRCDQLNIHCIVDKRLESKYQHLKDLYQTKSKKSITDYYGSFDIMLQKMKDPLKMSHTSALGSLSNPRLCEFEILFYAKTKVSSRLSKTELLETALNQNHPLLCRWLLTNLEQIEISSDILITPEDKDTFRPVAWYYTRLFYQTYKKFLNGANNIWPGQLCCCSSKHYDVNNCAKSGKMLLIVESEQKLEKLPKEYFGFEIYNHIKLEDNADGEFRAILQTQLSENEDSYYIYSNISGECAEILFKAHKKLTMVSGFPFKSKRFGSKHNIDRINTIQLFCRKKGIIPIGENHFPQFIDGVETDVLEECPTLAANLHVGDAIGPCHSSGTLGGFYEYLGRLCFLTCAHVMYDVETLLHLLKKPYDLIKRNKEVKAFLHTSSGPLEIGKVIRRIFEPDVSTVTSVDAALVEINCPAYKVDPTDYVRDSGNNPVHYNALGMSSVPLNENCLDHIQFAYASNIHAEAPGSVSKHTQLVDFKMEDATDVSFNNIGPVVAHVNGTVIPQLIFINPVHIQATMGPIVQQKTVCMYKQMLLNIPLQAGDSGTCIYISKGPGPTGCVGMAIAFGSGFSIVTPLKEILSRL